MSDKRGLTLEEFETLLGSGGLLEPVNTELDSSAFEETSLEREDEKENAIISIPMVEAVPCIP